MATVLEPRSAPATAPESSDRSFGFVFAVVFALIGCWPLFSGRSPRLWALGLAALFALVGAIQPALLHQLNRLWMALGRALHKVVSPLIMSAVFFVCVTPIAWIMRGHYLLLLRRRPDLSSYWIARQPEPPATETMKRQF
jgi:heme/copper-type cytochrome/quinol oxidase subunit 4